MASQQNQLPEASAETIERNMVEESKKAGIPAFQFDPDAPTSKKLEQVESVSYCSYLSFRELYSFRFRGAQTIPSDIYKEPKTKAVGVPTDIVSLHLFYFVRTCLLWEELELIHLCTL